MSTSPSPFCQEAEDCVDHVFFSCSYFALVIQNWLARWSSLVVTLPNLCEYMMEFLEVVDKSKKMKKFLLSLVYKSTLWIIWKASNALIFIKERLMIMITVSLNTSNQIKNRFNCNSINGHAWNTFHILDFFFFFFFS